MEIIFLICINISSNWVYEYLRRCDMGIDASALITSIYFVLMVSILIYISGVGANVPPTVEQIIQT